MYEAWYFAHTTRKNATQNVPCFSRLRNYEQAIFAITYLSSETYKATKIVSLNDVA